MAEAADPVSLARLVALADDVRPTDRALAAEACTIGRAPTCQIVVPRNTVSRLHALVVPEGPRYLLRDAGSANGPFVNGLRLHQPHLLADGDAIGLGSAAGALRFVDPDPTVVPVSRLRFDERALRFTLGGRTLDLTPNEFRLLRHLHQRAGAVCSRESCAEAVWGADFAPGLDAAALDRLVSNLRGKLRALAPGADLLQTRPALGYVLVP